MKASRAPGPVSYMQRHVSRANGEGGKKTKDSESGRPPAKKGSVAESGGGVLKKFKDLDNIPDFSWGDADAFTFSGDHGGNNANRSRHVYDQGDYDEDEYIDDSQAHGWTSPRASPPKATSFAVKEPLYHTKSAGGGVSPRFGGGRTNALAQHSHGPKSAPSKLVATHDSEDDEDNFDNVPDIYDTPPKKAQYSPRKESKPAVAAKAPPPLPFQKQQLEQQQQQQQQKAQRSAVNAASKAAPVAQSSSSSAKQAAAAPAGAAGAKAVGRQPAAAVAPQPLHVSISENPNTQYAPQSPPPPLPCERPINQPKDQSPKSPSHLTDQDRLFYTKQPRHVEFKPYTLQQYKMIKPKEYVELGKLRPDLNTDELIAKRKNLDRIKEFSKQLRQVNADILTQQPKLPSATEQNDLQIARQKYESTRQRALEFAKSNVPKPKVARNAQLDERRDQRGQYDGETDNGPTQIRDGTRRSQSAGERSGSYGGSRSNLGIPMDEDAFQAAKLQELEAKHQQSKARMEAIKRSLHGV